MIARGLIVVLGVLILASCAAPGLPSDLKPTETMLTPYVRFAVPVSAGLPKPVNVEQSIVAHYGKRLVTFNAQIQITKDKLDLVALDGLGRRALTLTWKAGHIAYSVAPWVKPKIRPADILADIAIVYWPEKLLKPALSDAGLKISQSTRRRTLSKRNDLLVAVNYSGGTGWNRSAGFTNFQLHYTLSIQSRKIDP